MNGGRFDFDDGGTYVGGWEEGKAHGHGVCTGPQGKGEYAGAWHYGFEVSGVYTWPSGNTYQGQWQNGKRHGLGVEQRGRWVYRGEWTQGYKGRYGVRQATNSQARYQGTWSAGFHDGYGTEIYVDGGSYQGQWLRGMRHGYGIRKSTTYGNAAKFRSKSHMHASLTSLRSGRADDEGNAEETKDGHDGRGGFVLRANSAAPQRRRRSLSERSLAVKRTLLSGLRIKKQHSTGDIHQRVTSMTGSLRSSGSTMSCTSEDSIHHHHALATAEVKTTDDVQEEVTDDSVTETYMGEWKNDARSGFGVCERSDGLRYHGEWANNAKCGFGVTTFRDGTREEGRYKNNVLVVSARRKGMLFMRASKFKEKVEQAVGAATRSASIAQQKADIAASRTSTARERSEQAAFVANQARDDSDLARIHATQFDPSFKQPGTSRRMLRDVGGESFGTDLSDAVSYSRHLSQTHSNQASFEKNLSVDMAEDYPSTSHQNSSRQANHVGHAHGHGSSQIQGNHVNFQLQPNAIGVAGPSGVGVTISGVGAHHLDHDIVEELPTPSHSNEPMVQAQVQRSAEGVDANKYAQMNQQPCSSLQAQHMNAQSSSRFSLSDDHFDQYVVTTGNQPRLRRNRPSLMRQSDVNEATTSGINRRSTLASARDRRAEPTPESATTDNMGSLPNLAELEIGGVRLRREDAARLASQRRQEVLREQEEQAILRANPLRYFLQPAFRTSPFKDKVLVTPGGAGHLIPDTLRVNTQSSEPNDALDGEVVKFTVKSGGRPVCAWLIKWKVPLLLAIANISLLCLFYNLLTYEKKKNH